MDLPLEGLKVLDFSTLLPGPYATQLLADMGAEVLRVESPTRPDLLQVLPPKLGKVSAAHATINRNKKSITLDLKKPESKAIIQRLVQEYDIVVEQFRPGVMSRLGLGYEDLSADHQGLIYCSITGYGQTGPLKYRAGHDINYLALSGLASYAGRKDTGPVSASTQIADIAGGSHHAVMGILAAHIARLRTGKGQHLDISMSDAALALNTMFGAATAAGAPSPELSGTMLNGAGLYDYYECACGGYLSVGSLEPQFAQGLLQALEMIELMPVLLDQRPEKQAEVRSKLAARILEKTRDEWTAIFNATDVCVEPVLSVEEALNHPHFVERNMVTEATLETGEKVRQINSAMPFARQRDHEAGKSKGADNEFFIPAE